MTTIDYMTDAGKPTNETPSAFAAWLKHHREQAGITPAQAARKAGLSRARWSHAEAGFEIKRGVRKPVGHTKDTVIRMANAVQGDVNKALVLAGYASVSRDEARYEADLEALRAAVRAVLSLNPSRHADLISCIQQLAAKPSPDTLGFLRSALGLSPQQQQYLRGFAESISSSARISDDAVSTERVIDTPRDDHTTDRDDSNGRATRS